MLYQKIVAIFSEVSVKHINILRGRTQNFGMLNLAEHEVTTGHWRLHEIHPYTKLRYNAICLSLLALYSMCAHTHHTWAFLEL